MEALSVNNLSLSYHTGLKSKSAVLHNISFNIKQGELISFIGVNGAGKTSLLKTLVGITKPTNGQVKVFGYPIASTQARAAIGFMPESPNFYENITAMHFLQLVAGLFNVSPRKSLARNRQLLKEVNLSQAANQPIKTFSKGMRQRLGFAQALVGEPKLLFLDEPLDGLDPIGRQELKESILKRQKEGLTVVLCSHILSDIAQMSNRIGIVHRGRLINLVGTKEFTKGQDLESVFVKHIKKYHD